MTAHDMDIFIDPRYADEYQRHPLTLVDVREPYEWDIGNLGQYGATMIPLNELGDRYDVGSPAAGQVQPAKRHAAAEAGMAERAHGAVREPPHNRLSQFPQGAGRTGRGRGVARQVLQPPCHGPH